MHGSRTMIARQSSSPIGGEEFPKLCAAVLRYNYKFSLGELYDRLKLWWIDPLDMGQNYLNHIYVLKQNVKSTESG